MSRSALYLLSLLLATRLALASQEGMLALGNFRLESPGIGSSGPIVVTGSQSSDGLQALTVLAFGKQFSLSGAQLKQLQVATPFNGVQLSYEQGYKDLGGRTVYLV